MTSKEAFLALNLLPNIGPIRIRKLLSKFETPQNILGASKSQLLELSGIGNEMSDSIINWEDKVDLREEKRRMVDNDIHAITLEEENYPNFLRGIYDPPYLLYCKGKLTPSDGVSSIGIVGSRKASYYGKEQTRNISFNLASAGYCIVSGLARGIDTVAHESALEAKGRTIAVLGSGIGNLYPPENQKLADRISENGALLSEYPVLYVAGRKTFPVRNRIVSGMTQALVVVEAPIRSGSLITANQAAEQGRLVFAVPGPINRPHSQGCHQLIRQGATLITSYQEILEEIQFTSDTYAVKNREDDNSKKVRPLISNFKLDDIENEILSCMKDEPCTIDYISEITNFNSSIISSKLFNLEMKLIVRQLPGKFFVRIN